MKAALIAAAVLFSALLLWRVALPMNHRHTLQALENKIRDTPENHTTEAQAEAAIAQVESLAADIRAATRRFTATRDRLNLALAASGILTGVFIFLFNQKSKIHNPQSSISP